MNVYFLYISLYYNSQHKYHTIQNVHCNLIASYKTDYEQYIFPNTIIPLI